MGFFKATLTLGSFRIFQQGLLFFQLAYFLSVFGSTGETDVYNVARTLAFFIALLFKFALSQLFIPVFAEWREQHGKEEAWRLASVVMIASAIVLTTAAATVAMLAPAIATLIAEPPHRDLCLQLIWQFSLFIVINGMCGIPISIYFSCNTYLVPAVASLLLNVCSIASIFFLADTIGVTAVVYGAIVGAALELAVLLSLINLGRERFRFRFCLSHPGLRQFRQLVTLRLASVTLMKLSVLVDQVFAKLLGPSAISSLAYADRLQQAPIMLIGSSVGTVSFSELSETAARGNYEEFQEKMTRYLRIVAFASIPLTVLLLMLAEPAIEVLFLRGEFDANDVRFTARALAMYSLGIFPLIIVSTLRGSLFALQDAATPLKASGFRFVLNIVLNALFIFALGLQIGGLAAATAVSEWATLVFMFWMFQRKVGRVISSKIKRILAKQVLAGVVMAAVLWALAIGPPSEWLASAVPIDILRLASVGISGILAYLLACALLKVEDVFIFANRISKPLRRKISRSNAQVLPSQNEESDD